MEMKVLDGTDRGVVIGVAATLIATGLIYVGSSAIMGKWSADKNAEQLKIHAREVQTIKSVLMAMLLEEDLGSTGLARELVGDPGFLRGVESYRAGEYEDAAQEWVTAASRGDAASRHALEVSMPRLREELDDVDLRQMTDRLDRVIRELDRLDETGPDDGE